MTKDMTDNFIRDFGEDLLEAICEAAWNRENVDGLVFFMDHHMRDAANWLHQGTFQYGEKEYLFELEQGNWRGCAIEYGENLDLKPPAVFRKVFRPRDPEHQTAKVVFPLWQKEEWFKKKQGEMNYDLTFSPTTQTIQHYRDWAAKKGMVIETEMVQP
ncbi:hypothetical protein [Fimbriiglobus ruber]|uniref:Uncharacterized protein n=1 Tax=Fimbriiglobus ruber TaxID=1908690 RepID=A0A225D9J2_9BACT|nr:hypothetical protein [Fimbriiglobus ruber]OWK35208.1 hypothetical protein FRUB_10050 [Fimbriiglobus ruber]OWK35447.1 hypothetical protein FRUB_08010 [Fimbriiglobus ruber]